MLLSELYTDFKNLETLSCNASILITVHPSFLFSLQDIIQPLLVVIAILCVPWMLLLKPFYLRHQHNIKKQGVRGELGQLLTFYFWVLGYPVLVTAVYWSKVLNFILISFSKEILAM